jgi:S1-C subfamily serine protease
METPPPVYYQPPPPPPPPYQPPVAPAEPPRSSAQGGRRLAVFVAAGVLVGAIVGGATGATLVSQKQSATTRGGAAYIAAPKSEGSPALTALGVSAAAVYAQDAPGVVTITTELGSSFRTFSEATGSGIVVNSSGDILTNEHVISGARQIRVTFKDGPTVPGTVSGSDASSDLAVVHVSVAAGQLHPLVLANSDAVQIGDPVLAIGSPFGLSDSLSSGIVSGLNRSGTAPSGRALTGLLQTDAAINPGNSGGPLLNAKGEVIGVDESIQSPVQGSVGVGFAVPINTAKRIISQLEKGQAVQHPWLGISGETLTPGLAGSLGISQQSGVLVVQVIAGSPAQKAGLQSTGTAGSGDDIITAIDGHNLASVEALTSYLDTKKVGDKVTMTVVRGGKSISVSATLADFQKQP